MMKPTEWLVVVADDEPAARRGVRQFLRRFPRFRVAAECRNGADVLRVLDDVQPHVVFLDVQMPGVDGFEVIRRRSPKRMPLIVFLTAYEEFAVRAFGVEALDYLVKPVSEARFAATIDRITRKLRDDRMSADEPFLAVQTSRGPMLLRAHEIDWIEAEGNYARLWVGERSHLLRESMNALEERLGAHGFVRAHRGALVRLGAVRKVVRDPSGGTCAVLLSGPCVKISRRRRAAFKRAVRRASK